MKSITTHTHTHTCTHTHLSSSIVDMQHGYVSGLKGQNDNYYFALWFTVRLLVYMHAEKLEIIQHQTYVHCICDALILQVS